MRGSFFIAAVLAVCATVVAAAAPPDCPICTSPTGCPGMCEQDADGNGLCTGFCGSAEGRPCAACTGAGSVNCQWDSTGDNCALWHF